MAETEINKPLNNWGCMSFYIIFKLPYKEKYFEEKKSMLQKFAIFREQLIISRFELKRKNN